MPNALLQESSPYLLQHAHNPVDWYPWCEEALQRAKEENKLILISIGYSACHWCHVMEKESFEDANIAALMNQYFICIKVDREERPDIDHIYMQAVQLMNGQGGWPLNCFALPDQRPIYGGTYFPKEDWASILFNLAQVYENKPEEVEAFATQLTEGIKKSDLIHRNTQTTVFDQDFLREIYSKWKKYFDYREGGYLRAPKFPLPNNFIFLLRYAHLFQDQDAENILRLTLDKMAMGGIYDHLGGGFARYSVDEHWFAPHFEKMLYDNGQLLSLYAEGYSKFKKESYKEVVYDTVVFIERELTSPEGGFYSALDADSEGEEGKFYVWDFEEIKTILKEDADFFSAVYHIKEKGNWEDGKNILFLSKETEYLASEFNLSKEEFRQKIIKCKSALLAKRAERIRPGLDHKILSSWNGLMLKGLVDAYKVFNETSFLQLALNNAIFIETKLINKEYKLIRSAGKEEKQSPSFLDDYAFVIEAFIELYQVTLEEKWMMLAHQLMNRVIAEFFDESSSMFFYTPISGEALITRKLELTDQVIPSSNSAIANSLFKLGFYFDKKEFKDLSLQMLQNMKDKISSYPSSYSNWLILILNFVFPSYEITITGNQALEKLKELETEYIPNKIISGAIEKSALPVLKEKIISGKTQLTLCVNNTCMLPVEEVTFIKQQILELRSGY